MRRALCQNADLCQNAYFLDTQREEPVCEYYTEGPSTVIWLMDFEQPQLTGVAKFEFNTWEWENSKVACATLSIPYDSTKLM